MKAGMGPQTSGSYEFDDFRIDAARRRLLHNNEALHLPPKVFDTLLILVEHRGRVVDKNEIIETIWFDTIVEENNLTQNISAIRKALGDSPGEPRYIATFPGRGYQFIGDVREHSPGNGSQHANADTSATIHALNVHGTADDENGNAAPAVIGRPVPESRPIYSTGRSLLLALVATLAAISGLWLLMGTRSQTSAEPVRSNTDAYRAYLKGQYFVDRDTDDEIQKSTEYFQQAIDLDANYALAYAGLGAGYLRLHERGIKTGGRPALLLAREALERAIEIDDTVAAAHAKLAFIAFRYEWDFAKSDREYRRARELDPNLLEVWHLFYLMTVDRMPEAETEFRMRQETRPLEVGDLALYYYFLRRYERAEQEVAKSLDVNGEKAPIRTKLGLIYVAKGMYPEAIVELKKAVELSHNGIQTLGILGHCHAVAGNKAEAEKILSVLITKSSDDFFWANYSIAVIYAGLGKNDGALDFLEKAYREHSLGPAFLRFDPRLDNLRQDPRFQALSKKVGLAG